ncbi:hypothetical protein Tco_1435889 [Tanacetum coccineum]
MSSPAHTDLETVSLASKPEEAPLETNECQSPPLRTTPLSYDHTLISPDYTPATPLSDEEFETSEPSNTRITTSHSTASSDSTTPLFHDHPFGLSARIVEAVALSPSSFHKRYISSYETLSSSPTLPIRKRYQGTPEIVENTEDESSDSDAEREGSDDEGHGLDDEGHGLDDMGHGLEEEGLSLEEEAAPEGQCRMSRWLMGLPPIGYLLVPHGVTPRSCAPVQSFSISNQSISSPVHVPSSPGWSPMPSSDLPAIPSPVASPTDSSPVASPATVKTESFLAELEAQIELQGGFIHDHTQRLDALPPILFEGYDWDFRDLYTMSGEFRDEIFSQRYRLRSVEQDQKRATMTFSAIWRPVLALEAWASQTDAQRAALWHAIYDTQGENYDLRMLIAKEKHERLELTDHVARMERRQESREE